MVSPAPWPSAEAVWAALEGIPDPEIPVVNVVEMGIVREVQVHEGRATITMTPTFSGCPALHAIRESLEHTVRKLGLEAEVRTVLSPLVYGLDQPRGQAAARALRHRPPKPVGDLIQLEPSATRCPRCGSLDTTLKNSFGSTLCKSIYVCNTCHEPFEGFKAV